MVELPESTPRNIPLMICQTALRQTSKLLEQSHLIIIINTTRFYSDSDKKLTVLVFIGLSDSQYFIMKPTPSKKTSDLNGRQ